jgi:excisionase family DNA binding protein
MEQDKFILTTSDLMRKLDISKPTALKLINRPDFPVIRVGNRIKIPVDGLRRWLERNEGKRIEL